MGMGNSGSTSLNDLTKKSEYSYRRARSGDKSKDGAYTDQERIQAFLNKTNMLGLEEFSEPVSRDRMRARLRSGYYG